METRRRCVRLLLGCAALATWTLAAAAPREARIEFGAVAHVSADRADLPHVEPHVARDPTDPRTLLAASMVYHESGTVARPGVYRSTDDGETWRAVRLSAPVTAVDPWLAFDLEGTAYLLHLPGRVHVSRDGGRRWEEPRELPRAGIGPLDFAKVVVDHRPPPEGDRVYVVSASADRDPTGLPIGPIVVFRGRAGGEFERTARIAPALLDYQIGAAPVVLPDGRLAVAFSEVSHAGELLPPGRIWMTRSADAGIRFDPPSLVVADGGGSVGVAVDATGGRFHGRLYLAFVHLADGNLLLVRSDDAGHTWSGPVRINDAPYAAFAVPVYPALAVNDRGELGILWSDFRDDLERQHCYGVYFAYSHDGGASVSRNAAIPGARSCPDRAGGNRMRVDAPDGRPIADRFVAGGDYYGLTARTDGRFHAVWSDTRTGVFQLWSTTVEVRP